jgi:hypothetical protein
LNTLLRLGFFICLAGKARRRRAAAERAVPTMMSEWWCEDELEWFDEETSDPLLADDRNFYKVERELFAEAA